MHVFSDGEDNASDELRRKELMEQQKNFKDSVSIHHKFLYSFNTSFEAVKNIAETIEATVIMVQTDNIKVTLDERNKQVFRFFSKNLAKAVSVKKGFNIANRDTPDIITLHKQLMKLNQVFQGDILKTEGIFRESASVNRARDFAQRLANADDSITDYDDPIKIAHATKTLLANCPLIPSSLQKKIVNEGGSKKFDAEKISFFRDIFASPYFPEKNVECLKILTTILKRVIDAQKELPTNKSLTIEGVSRIFSNILFNTFADSQTLQQDITSITSFIIEKAPILFPSL